MWIPVIKFKDIQVVGGQWSAQTAHLSGIVHQVIVKAISLNNTFSFVMVNEDNLEVVRRDITEDGELNELLTLPVSGIYTLKIENAIIDEKFDIYLYEQR